RRRGRRGPGAAADRPVSRARAALAVATRRGLGQRGLAGERALGVPLPATGDRRARARARARRPAAPRRESAAAGPEPDLRRTARGRLSVAVLRHRAPPRPRDL